jgi:hypothetical protein
MSNKGLLFIPDISGFTRFVNETEIEHSRLIIQELLEVLINANEIGLEISEIEGDAILFYKYGDPPSLQEIYRQVEKMFCEFHKNITSYDNRKYCQCKACVSAIDLTLKVITHYGEFTGYNVNNFNKLIGKDIIVAHQLLKNDIEQHEYWLITNNLINGEQPKGLADWMKWMMSAKQTETGTVPFHYTFLSQLKNELQAEPLPRLDLAKKVKVLSMSQEFDTDMVTLFHGCGDFNFRHRWLEWVIRVEEVTHFLPRVGMKCRSIMENGEVSSYSSSYYYNGDSIEFSETEEKSANTTYYILKKIEPHRIRLTMEYYVDKNIASAILYKVFRKKKMEAMWHRSLDHLTEFVKEINFEVVE